MKATFGCYTKHSFKKTHMVALDQMKMSLVYFEILTYIYMKITKIKELAVVQLFHLFDKIPFKQR